MSSATEPQPDPAADEIVAYLDGELPPQDARRVESRLATDDAYRQELNELDRAWEALDALPSPTVDDGFARTTIELACVAAAADQTELTTYEQAAKRNRMWRWVAAGVAAGMFGFLAGRALIPHRNEELLADLPAIYQLEALRYVDDVKFLRLLKAAVPQDQLVKDEPTLKRNVKELTSANDPDFQARRDWVRTLPPDRKAVLADRTRSFNDLEPASQEREQMRKVMDDIRRDPDAADLQKTLVAYGQWLSRHSAGQQEQIREQMHDLSPEKQVAIVKKHIEKDDDLLIRHLSDADANIFRQEIVQMAKKRPGFGEWGQGRKSERGITPDEVLARQATGMAIREFFRERDDKKRGEIESQLISKLSPEAQAHWKKVSQSPRRFDRGQQMAMWLRDAMDMKVEQSQLEDFFASDDLSPDKRQALLDKPRPRMESELKQLYINWKLGIVNPGPMFGEGEQGRMQWDGPGMGPPDRGGSNRPPGFEPPRGPRPDGPPGERRPRRRPPGPPAPAVDPPPPKQEAI